MQRTLKWDADRGSDLQYLPVMRADAVLRSRRTGRTLVADAKYYGETLVSFHDRERVRSGHLYQITAYLRRGIEIG
jgi:5-methylcytosine-specific restriction enzyme subunit McrC